MLKFFRSFRQKLIIQENARKYLLYAVGEILLVGILIARPVRDIKSVTLMETNKPNRAVRYGISK